MPSLQPTDRRLEVIPDKGGVGTDRLQGTRHDPLRLAASRRRGRGLLRAPLRMVSIPIAHDVV